MHLSESCEKQRRGLGLLLLMEPVSVSVGCLSPGIVTAPCRSLLLVILNFPTRSAPGTAAAPVPAPVPIEEKRPSTQFPTELWFDGAWWHTQPSAAFFRLNHHETRSFSLCLIRPHQRKCVGCPKPAAQLASQFSQDSHATLR